MARYTGPVCKFCRREGLKLFLKGDRCYTEKCSIDRRAYPPGQHGQARSKYSEYGSQLREKQKVKRIYQLLESQFRVSFERADREKGITGENLLRGLELRLDSLVYHMGFSNSRRQARQLILHGHFQVNGRSVNIPSYVCSEGDQVVLKEKSRKIESIVQSLESVDRRGVPSWLELDKQIFAGKVKTNPGRSDITMPIQEQLIVELYSK